MDNQEIEIELYEEPQEIELENSDVVIISQDNVIESISVNGIEQQVDENKNVDITMPTKTSDLINDTNFVSDSSYVHTDNNYTLEEKTKLAGLSNYDDTKVKEDISDIQDDISNLNSDITDLNVNKADRTEIPTTLAELTDDNTHRLVSDTEKTNWNNKSDFSGSYNDLTNKPNIPTKTSDLTNDNGFIDNSVSNLINYTLATETGHSIDLSMNSTTYELTLSLKNSAGTVLNSKSVDLPLETMVVGGSYDSTNKKIVLTLKNGSTIDVPVADLISGLQSEITSSNKLDADLVDDTNSTNKFTSTSEKSTWNAKYDKPSGGIPSTDMSNAVQTSLGKADTAIQDISGKQDVLTAGNNIQINNNVISATDTTYTAGTGISIQNGVISNTQTSAEWGNITGTLADQTDLNTALGNKQDTLVSGTNIKTINNESILGSGNINIQGGSGGDEIYIGDEQDAPETTKLLIDEDELQWNGSEVVNTLSGNETNKAPSVKAVNEGLLDVYSTTEQVIGTWIDGKPLYRIVVETTSGSSLNTWATIYTNILVDKLIYLQTYYGKGNGIYPSQNNTSFSFYWDLYDNTIKERHTSDYWHSIPLTIILEYTKTTD